MVAVTVPIQREITDLICATLAQVERDRAELFRAIPTERERIDQICRTVAEVNRCQEAWLKSFVDKG